MTMNRGIIIEWSEEKNEVLKKERGISFEMVAVMIESGDILDDIDHPNTKKYPNQRMFVVQIKEYVYMVPFVKDDKKVFLKTIILIRKYTKLYLK